MTTAAATKLRQAARDELHQVARDELMRDAPFTLERAEGDSEPGDGLTLVGHAAVFNRLTLIDSWEGRFKEQCAPGCFRRTFRNKLPVMQFDHGRHPLIGSIPIGKLSRAEEDDIGAYVEGRLASNWLIQPVRDAIADESVDGMSFRFTVVKEEWVDAEGKVIRDDEEILRALWASWDAPEDELLTRTLKEVKVPELGPVVFPAYEDTDVGVRSGRTVIDLAQLRSDPEERRRMARLLWMAEEPTRAEGHDDHSADPPEDVPDPAPPADGHARSDDDDPPEPGHSSDNHTTEPARAEDDDPVKQLLARMESDVARGREYEEKH